ncbi:flagellar biosynthesis protein [Pseudorhodobacter sp. W20_MBD10_FR17]|uniref:flagellar biosynthesis protein n=1 Tax=Pseudorhodobacter sp. W20_MBD10_FR17 TaxID=3240266 RepID=UPI003F9D92EC
MPPLQLEVFEAAGTPKVEAEQQDLDALDEARLVSYEQGYAAGWDDSVSAQNEEKSQLAADLAHNLQSLSFTYHEARVHVLRALEPLLTELVGQFLPEVARTALGATVLQALLPLAESAADTPIKILFNPASRDAIEPLIQQANCPPLSLVEEPTLGEGQVFLLLGENETRVDLDGAITEAKSALQDFFKLMTKDTKSG